MYRTSTAMTHQLRHGVNKDYFQLKNKILSLLCCPLLYWLVNLQLTVLTVPNKCRCEHCMLHPIFNIFSYLYNMHMASLYTMPKLYNLGWWKKRQHTVDYKSDTLVTLSDFNSEQCIHDHMHSLSLSPYPTLFPLPLSVFPLSLNTSLLLCPSVITHFPILSSPLFGNSRHSILTSQLFDVQ